MIYKPCTSSFGTHWIVREAADQIMNFISTPFILGCGYTLNNKNWTTLGICKAGHGRIRQEYWLGFKNDELIIERNNQIWRVTNQQEMLAFKEQALQELDISDDDFHIRLATKEYGDQIQSKSREHQIKMGKIANRERRLF